MNWNDGSRLPTQPGWYAIQICWDADEGIHVFAVAIPGEEWDRFKGRHTDWSGPHPTKDEAVEWGHANDPEGPL